MHPISRVAVVGNLHKTDLEKHVRRLLAMLRERGVATILAEDIATALGVRDQDVTLVARDQIGVHSDLVISFGGDGTILDTARRVEGTGVPILGVKLGGLGFLAEMLPEELPQNLDEILRGEFQVIERMLLCLELPGKKPVHALNDVVIDKGATLRLLRLRTCIDDAYLNTYIADGLIVATPTGSTAYSLAAGGPLLLPTMNAMVITPICPHSLTARPIVIPHDRTVTVEVAAADRTAMVNADGRVVAEIGQGMPVTIRRGDYTVRLVHSQGRHFFDVLRAKLHWGEDIREDGDEG
jgi:NAD+ kinase